MGENTKGIPYELVLSILSDKTWLPNKDNLIFQVDRELKIRYTNQIKWLGYISNA